MVRGLDVFKEFFSGMEENYVIIGGTACNIHEEEMQQEPRATKDIDLVLIVEALSDAFVRRFWEFIKTGGYEQRQRGESDEEESERKHEYFRFIKPAEKSFPKQIELFSRNLGLMDIPEDAHITPIPAGEDLSSLSAILMDDDYYNFTIRFSDLVGGVHYANPESLICLKAKAFLDMTKRKAEGRDEDQNDIDKHKKDVFRMIPALNEETRFSLPPKIEKDMREFLNVISNDLPGKELFKAMRLPRLNAEMLVEKARKIFLGTEQAPE